MFRRALLWTLFAYAAFMLFLLNPIYHFLETTPFGAIRPGVFSLMAMLWLSLGAIVFRCKSCGQSIFKGKIFYWPWPHRSCAKCGAKTTEM